MVGPLLIVRRPVTVDPLGLFEFYPQRDPQEVALDHRLAAELICNTCRNHLIAGYEILKRKRGRGQRGLICLPTKVFFSERDSYGIGAFQAEHPKRWTYGRTRCSLALAAGGGWKCALGTFRRVRERGKDGLNPVF